MWSQEVFKDLKSDLVPEASPPTDGASVQSVAAPVAMPGLEISDGSKDSHSPSSKQADAK